MIFLILRLLGSLGRSVIVVGRNNGTPNGVRQDTLHMGSTTWVCVQSPPTPSRQSFEDERNLDSIQRDVVLVVSKANRKVVGVYQAWYGR
jgi:hypothetical protein